MIKSTITMPQMQSCFLNVAAFLLLTTALPAQSWAANAQMIFASPEKAVEGLIFAARSNHTMELSHMLGTGGDQLVFSGDDVADQEARAKFTAAYDKAHKLETEPNGNVVLIVGAEEWPLPIPIVHEGQGWRFDAESGKQEILARRIGRNELNVIGVCRTYVDAQREFSVLHPLDKGSHEYAQKFQSTQNQLDGLYWPVTDGEEESPLGPLMASAEAEGYSADTTPGKNTPYHGYYYKILKRQGAHARGGAEDYVTDGHMTGGFALLAYPASYGDSGVMSFIVNQNGIIHEKNLGPDTATVAHQMSDYDPDESWGLVED